MFDISETAHYLPISSDLLKILNTLKAYHVLVKGGYLRDRILQRPYQDVDLVINLDRETLRRIFYSIFPDSFIHLSQNITNKLSLVVNGTQHDFICYPADYTDEQLLATPTDCNHSSLFARLKGQVLFIIDPYHVYDDIIANKPLSIQNISSVTTNLVWLLRIIKKMARFDQAVDGFTREKMFAVAQLPNLNQEMKILGKTLYHYNPKNEKDLQSQTEKLEKFFALCQEFGLPVAIDKLSAQTSYQMIRDHNQPSVIELVTKHEPAPKPEPIIIEIDPPTKLSKSKTTIIARKRNAAKQNSRNPYKKATVEKPVKERHARREEIEPAAVTAKSPQEPQHISTPITPKQLPTRIDDLFNMAVYHKSASHHVRKLLKSLSEEPFLSRDSSLSSQKFSLNFANVQHRIPLYEKAMQGELVRLQKLIFPDHKASTAWAGIVKDVESMLIFIKPKFYADFVKFYLRAIIPETKLASYMTASHSEEINLILSTSILWGYNSNNAFLDALDFCVAFNALFMRDAQTRHPMFLATEFLGFYFKPYFAKAALAAKQVDPSCLLNYHNVLEAHKERIFGHKSSLTSTLTLNCLIVLICGVSLYQQEDSFNFVKFIISVTLSAFISSKVLQNSTKRQEDKILSFFLNPKLQSSLSELKREYTVKTHKIVFEPEHAVLHMLSSHRRLPQKPCSHQMLPKAQGVKLHARGDKHNTSLFGFLPQEITQTLPLAAVTLCKTALTLSPTPHSKQAGVYKTSYYFQNREYNYKLIPENDSRIRLYGHLDDDGVYFDKILRKP